nr:hypothetical protein [Bosea lupini]
MIAAYIDEFIMFCVGLWMTAVGLGHLPTRGNAASQTTWVTTVLSQFKWMRPLLLVFALVLAIGS